MVTCPHGDPTCPCVDGLICHYEGLDPFRCPNMPPWFPKVYPLGALWPNSPEMVVTGESHCHVEGCRWDVEECGLARIYGLGSPVPGAVEWACGASRAVARIERDEPGFFSV